eukprot:Skav217623  [mRNA]  locus=scaffold2172:625524:635804:+ [translate_table: standard]
MSRASAGSCKDLGCGGHDETCYWNCRVESRFGTKLLVFGFLYNMEDHCDAVEVLKVEDVVKSSWFLNAVDEHAATDGIVILAHMDYRDALVDHLWQSLRDRVGSTKPIQIFAGHSHIRGYRPLGDHRKPGMLQSIGGIQEGKCPSSQVGFLSFQHRADGSGLDFEHANITGNVKEMTGALHLDDLLPAAEVAKALEAAKAAAGTAARPQGVTMATALAVEETHGPRHMSTFRDRTLGCSPEHYYLSQPLQEKNSLRLVAGACHGDPWWSFYMEQVIPATLFDSGHQLAIVGTGALSYDIYPGTFTLNDVYTTSPYGNFWFILQQSLAANLVRK